MLRLRTRRVLRFRPAAEAKAEDLQTFTVAVWFLLDFFRDKRPKRGIRVALIVANEARRLSALGKDADLGKEIFQECLAWRYGHPRPSHEQQVSNSQSEEKESESKPEKQPKLVVEKYEESEQMNRKLEDEATDRQRRLRRQDLVSSHHE